MTRTITIVGSSAAVNEPWAGLFVPSLKTELRDLETRDQNFALTVSGGLWQVVASRLWEEQEAITRTESRVVSPEVKARTAIELLRSWREGDEREQRDTLEYLRTALDENRIRGSKLFEQE